MEPFATPSELAAFLGRPSFAGDELAQARLILDSVSAAVRETTRQAISFVEDDAVELAGRWEPLLELPERPIRSVSSVSLDGLELVEDTDFVVTADGLRRGPLGTAWAGDAIGGCGHWGGPRSVVAVVYSHGLTVDDPAYATAKAVTLGAAARSLGNTGGIVQEVIGSYSVTYGYQRQGAGELVSGEKARLRAAGLTRRPSTTITRGVLAS